MPTHQILVVAAVASIPALTVLLVALLVAVSPGDQQWWTTPVSQEGGKP
jgi:hypothetical protein